MHRKIEYCTRFNDVSNTRLSFNVDDGDYLVVYENKIMLYNMIQYWLKIYPSDMKIDTSDDSNITEIINEISMIIAKDLITSGLSIGMNRIEPYSSDGREFMVYFDVFNN